MTTHEMRVNAADCDARARKHEEAVVRASRLQPGEIVKNVGITREEFIAEQQLAANRWALKAANWRQMADYPQTEDDYARQEIRLNRP